MFDSRDSNKVKQSCLPEIAIGGVCTAKGGGGGAVSTASNFCLRACWMSGLTLARLTIYLGVLMTSGALAALSWSRIAERGCDAI